MKIGLASYDRQPNETIRLGIMAEKTGLDSFWVSDHLTDFQGPKIDPWTTFGAIARETQRLFMGSWVTDAQRCHPAKLAQILATLSHISNSRVALGIGAGEAMNTVPFGLPFRDPESRIAQLSEALQVMRLLWASTSEEPVSFDGRFFKLQDAWLNLRARGKIPVYLGIFGSRKGLELVGKQGDGWLAWINSPETFRLRSGIIRRAMKEAGRTPHALDFVAPIYTCLSNDRRRISQALKAIKRTLVRERYALRLMGFQLPHTGKTFQNTLATESEKTASSQAYAEIPEDVALRFLACGSASSWIERVEEFKSAGATHVIILFLDHVEEQLKMIGSSMPVALRA